MLNDNLVNYYNVKLTLKHIQTAIISLCPHRLETA